MVLGRGGARGAKQAKVALSGGGADRLEKLLMDAAREFSEMPQARMGLTAFCHCTYGADTLELLTQCGFIGPAQEHAGAAEAASSTVWPWHVCAEQGAPSKPSSGIAPVGEVVGGPNTVGGPIVAVKTEAASKPTAASAELLRETCRCCTSTCFDFVCVARASRARYNTKVGKPMEDTGSLRAAVAGSSFCELCKCAACSKHNVGRTRFCFTKPCVTQHMPRPLRSQSGAQDETSDWSTADYCNMHGRHSLPETWPPSLKVAAKLGWLLMQNTPLDYLVWMDFADALAARRANSTVSSSDVTWLFMAHCIKWPVAVSRFHEYALRACDARVGTAAAIVDSLVRVLRDLSGQAFPQMHARMSSKGRMHSSTGIIVHAQWLGLLRKLDLGTEAAAGDVVLHLGVSQSAYVLNPCQDDAVQLVAGWLAAFRQEWPRQVHVATFAECADAIVQTVARARTMSHGSAGPLYWGHVTAEAEHRRQSSPEPPRRKRAIAPGYSAKHFAKCVLLRYETALQIQWAEPPLCSLSMAAVLKWTPDETGQCDAIANMALGEAVRVFGYSPLLVSGFACFASAVDELQMSLLFRAPERDLFGVVAKWRKELEAASPEIETVVFQADLFSPVMADFCEAAAQLQGGPSSITSSAR